MLPALCEIMIQIIALIYAGKRGLEGLREFESKAISILREHSGILVSASTSSPSISSGPDEVHVIQFPSNEDFDAYKRDVRLVELSGLRQEVIRKIELHITNEFHVYK